MIRRLDETLTISPVLSEECEDRITLHSVYTLIAKFSARITLHLGSMGALHYLPDHAISDALSEKVIMYFGSCSDTSEWVERIISAIHQKYCNEHAPENGLYLFSDEVIQIMVASAPTETE